MADKIHGKRKDWPHFDKFHLGSDAYAEGYDRIFGSKNESTSGIQKRSKKNSPKVGSEYEEGGSDSRKRNKKSKRKGKEAQP